MRLSQILDKFHSNHMNHITTPQTSSCGRLVGLGPEAEDRLRIIPLSLSFSASLSKRHSSKCHDGLPRPNSKSFPLFFRRPFSFSAVTIQNSFVHVHFKVDSPTHSSGTQRTNKWGPVVSLIWLTVCGSAGYGNDNDSMWISLRIFPVV